ncbi:MAG: hypothetical protein LUE13_02265 [Akkermansiaceae bacterium]|nr:hypothetical protein [Akkermansiaceae bacterium]
MGHITNKGSRGFTFSVNFSLTLPGVPGFMATVLPTFFHNASTLYASAPGTRPCPATLQARERVIPQKRNIFTHAT